MRSLDRILSWSLHAAVIVLTVFAMAANFLIIAQTLFSPFTVVRGDSMSPALREGDAVIVTMVDPDAIRAGDVVTFANPEQPGENIIHRVAALREEDGVLCAVTKGDANQVDDPIPTPVKRITGKVAAVLPRLGTFLAYLQSPPGFVICVICPFFLLLLHLIAGWYLSHAGTGGGLLARRIIDAR